MLNRLCFYSAIAFSFFLPIHSNAGSAKEAMPKEALYTNDSNCDYYRNHLSGFVKNGYFDNGEMALSVPRVYVDFTLGDTIVSKYMLLADLNRDGMTELIYRVNITAPQHIESKIYILDSFSADVARSLIDDKYNSPYHEPLMKKIAARWDHTNQDSINDESIRLALPEEMLKLKKPEDPWRVTVVKIDDQFYLVADGVQSKMLMLARFSAGEAIKPEMICVFDDLLH